MMLNVQVSSDTTVLKFLTFSGSDQEKLYNYCTIIIPNYLQIFVIYMNKVAKHRHKCTCSLSHKVSTFKLLKASLIFIMHESQLISGFERLCMYNKVPFKSLLYTDGKDFNKTFNINR